MRKQNVTDAFDDTGLNVYKDVYGFGRTKSVSYRLFRGAFNAARVRNVRKDNRAVLTQQVTYGTLRFSQGDLVAVRVRKAVKRLRHVRSQQREAILRRETSYVKMSERPYKKEGKNFFYAGSNSSCSFYLSNSGGKLWKMCIDTWYDRDLEECIDEVSLYELPAPYRVGYLGNRN